MKHIERKWPPDEVAQLFAHVASFPPGCRYLQWQSIAEKLGRTKHSVTNKWERIIGRRRKDLQARRHEQHQVTGPVISEKEIAERDCRSNLQPRDLTAALMGDPLPGYSALEVKGK